MVQLLRIIRNVNKEMFELHKLKFTVSFQLGADYTRGHDMLGKPQIRFLLISQTIYFIIFVQISGIFSKMAIFEYHFKSENDHLGIYST